jgi:hypothetical protein
MFNESSAATAIDNTQGDAGRDLIPYDGGDVTFGNCGRAVGGDAGPRTAEISGAIWSGGDWGSALQFDGSNDYVEGTLPNDIAYNAPFTAIIRAKALQSQALQGLLNLQNTDLAEANQVLFIYYRTVDNGLLVGRKGAATHGAKPATAITQTDWNTICATSDGSDARATVYINGVLNDTNVSSGVSPYDANKWRIGGSRDPNYSNCLVEYFYLWSRALTVGEIASVHRDPYQMFRR